MRKKWLITIDLDGTFLRNDTNSMLDVNFHEYNLEMLKKVQEQGHVVSIVTGRPWKDAKKVYEALGLDTIIANYNGAHVHNPTDKGFVELVYSINRNTVLEMLDLPSVKRMSRNIIIESLADIKVQDASDTELLKKMNLTGDTEVKEWSIEEGLSINPQSVFIDIDFKDRENDVYELVAELKRKFGSSMLFRVWDFRQERDWLGIEVAQKGSTKGTAMQYIASYYNIPLTNTIAFGDGLNDREMLLDAAFGIAMKNAKGTVKTYADDITDFTNNEAGVGKYLKDFFEIE